MSEFDKEAEREKLRKQLEREEKDREVTQRMSDLLLKGATMTNKHCRTCGSPLFRYGGQTFCPTCQEAVEAGTSEQTAEAQATSERANDSQTADESADATIPVESPSEATEADATPTAEPSRPATPDGTSTAAESETPTMGDLAETRASLARTLSTLVAQAEASTDPRRARDLLAAAREAAETLAAVERVEGNR